MEHLLLFKTDYKPTGKLWIDVPGQYEFVDADNYVTWKTAVKHVIKRIGQSITPEFVYKGIQDHFPIKLKKTYTPQATIQRTLQELEAEGFLNRIARGDL